MATQPSLASEIISRLIQTEAEQSKMLPATPLEIDLALKAGLGFYVDLDGKPVSYSQISRMSHYDEIGGAVTNPEFRHRGYARRVISQAILAAQVLSERKPLIALTNSESTKLFQGFGFRPAKKEMIHAEVWEPCKKCREFCSWPSCHCNFLMLKGKFFHSKGLPENRSTVQYSVIDFDPDFKDDLQRAIDFYCNVWREAPWLEDWWTEDMVKSIYYDALSQPHAVFKIAVWREQVIGLSVGFLISTDDTIKRCPGIEKMIRPDKPIFYIADLATDSNYRWHGIGRALTDELIKAIPNEDGCNVILRTHQDALVAQRLYEKAGFKNTLLSDRSHTDRQYWHRYLDDPSDIIGCW